MRAFMSEPVKLQERLEAAFAEAPRRSARVPLPQDAVVETTAAAHAPEGQATVRNVIAGAGLLFGALALATGLAAGFYIAAVALGLAGIAGALFLLRMRRPVAGVEATHDRSWERSETSEILSAIHDALGDIVVMRALDGRILSANAVLSELTGASDVVGQTCEALGLPFRRPDPFPQNGLMAARIAHVLRRGPWIGAFVRAVYAAEFGEGRDISDLSLLAGLLTDSGAPAQDVLAEAESTEAKIGLRAAVIEAEALGIFGAPSFVTPDRELFWGNDRLDDAVDWALRTVV